MWVLELKLARIHEKLIFDRFISFFIITYPFQSLLSINCSILTFRKTRIWKFETGTRNRVGRLIDIEWNAFIHFPKFYISRDIIFLSFLFSFFFFKLSKMKKWFRRKEISRSDKIHVTCYCIYRPFQLNIYRSIYTHTRTQTYRYPATLCNAFFARDVTPDANYSASVHRAHNLPSCIAIAWSIRSTRTQYVITPQNHRSRGLLTHLP